uniref:Uncharacterized protein n=1 Tax=Anguilla anguilla TaxID=7936 RepID=A0A0E9VN59_ANGAN
MVAAQCSIGVSGKLLYSIWSCRIGVVEL